MMKHKDIKTNAMRLLDAAQIPYEHHSLDIKEALSGVQVAEYLGIDPNRVFKTLVTEGRTGSHYVFLIPVAKDLDLKKAACAVHEKSIRMIKERELEPLTGYVHGGCSPIGMKKSFMTVVDETAVLYDQIIFSAGRIGSQIQLSVDELGKLIPLDTADLTTDL